MISFGLRNRPAIRQVKNDTKTLTAFGPFQPGDRVERVRFAASGGSVMHVQLSTHGQEPLGEQDFNAGRQLIRGGATESGLIATASVAMGVEEVAVNFVADESNRWLGVGVVLATSVTTAYFSVDVGEREPVHVDERRRERPVGGRL